MNTPQSEQGRQERRGGYVAYDELRQIVRDLMAPLYERLDGLRDEVHEIKRRPQQEAENRGRDVATICLIIGVLIAVAGACNGFIYVAVSIWLHFAK